MSLKLLVGPVGAGKTEHAVAALQTLKQRHPLATAWALMATERQIHAFRKRLIAPGGGILNLHTFNFQMLYTELAQAAGRPQRVLHSAPRAALLREILRERWREPGAIFRPLPGFTDRIADLIDELRQWLITPDQFAASAGTDDKHSELAEIYARYDQRLNALHLRDREGLGVFALDCLRADRALGNGIDWLLVDGFDQLNPLHAALIAELGSRAAETLVTLTLPDATAEAPASFNRFTLARDRLLAAYRAAQGLPPEGDDDGDLVSDYLPAPADGTAARRSVRHLVDQLWTPLAEPAPVCAYAPGSLCAPGVGFLEAPEPAAETAAVLRRVKALLLGVAGVGAACRPDDILIATRDWNRYGPHLRALASRYGVPLAAHEGASLSENPAVAALLRALALPDSDFRRGDVLDALSSPYLRVPGLDGDGLALLEEAARRGIVLRGRDDWRAALAALASNVQPAIEEDADRDDAPLLAPVERIEATAAALENWFDALAMAGVADIDGFTDEIDAWIGPETAATAPLEAGDAAEMPRYTFGLLAAVRADTDAARVARDLAALAALKRALRSLRASAALLDSLGMRPAEPLTRAEFVADVRRAVAGVTLDDPAGRDGRVLATTVNDARGLPHRHVFILGLSESIFPAPVPEDPLLLESERHALQQRGLPLPLREERSDDTGLFYELAGLAGDTLTLSRPVLRDGADWIESALWRRALSAFDGPMLTRLKVGACTPAAEAATVDEAALAIGSACARGDLPETERALADWLAQTDAPVWARLGGAHSIEASRLTRSAACDRYAGKLADAGLIEQVARRFGADYGWSASQLNQLGECGFRFFSSRLLGLRPLEPPAAGLDVLQRGTLVHDLLEAAYARIRDEGLTITPAHLDRALALLDAEAPELFARAPTRLGFRPQPGWAQEQQLMRQQVTDLIRADFAGDVVSRQCRDAPLEGSGERLVVAVEHDYEISDLFTLDDGQPVRVRGRFDRIDRQGDRWLVVDYKTGSTKIGREETLRGRNFQMLIYVLALRSQQPRGAAGGFFWHVNKQETSGTLWLDTEAGTQVVREGSAHIARRIAEAQDGDFSVEPNGVENDRCSRHCDYQALCRMAVMPRGKPRVQAAL
jgi:ATP-dependent helicase/DNAse subunit B